MIDTPDALIIGTVLDTAREMARFPSVLAEVKQEEALLALRARLTAGDAAMRKGGVPQWQTIDSAPKDGRYVDLWSIERDHGFGFRTVNAFWKDGGWHQRHWGKLTCSTVTHWMELPTGPGTAAPQPPAADTSLEYAQIFEEGRLRGRAEHIAETRMVDFAARMYGIEPLDRDGIIEACAKVAEAYEPICDRCPSGVAAAIRAMKVQK